jgi:hypothetical protein
VSGETGGCPLWIGVGPASDRREEDDTHGHGQAQPPVIVNKSPLAVRRGMVTNQRWGRGDATWAGRLG